MAKGVKRQGAPWRSRTELSVQPNDRLGAGLRLLQKNDFFAAASILELAVADDPSSLLAKRALMAAYRRDARYLEAIALADALLALDSRDQEALFEKAVSLLRSGEGKESLAVFDALIAVRPEHAAAWFGSHGPALEENGLSDALERLEQGASLERANVRYWGFIYAYRLLDGQETEEFYRTRLEAYPNRRIISDGVIALLPHRAKDCRIFGVAGSLLAYALGQAKNPGLTLEFGVRRGTSLAILAGETEDIVHGFDSFEGLPENWLGSAAGHLTTGAALPIAPANARLHPGWFEESLPPFLEQEKDDVRFVNVDSDIYSSARFVLFSLKERLQPGSVIVFDEMIGNRSWRDDEYKAFQEFIAETGFSYEIIAIAPATKQVAVRLLGR